MAGNSEVAEYIISDNRRYGPTQEEFEAASVCPICGGELMVGHGELRLNNTSEMNMNTDIDSGQKLEGELSAKYCSADGYSLVKVSLSGYEGF